MDQDFGAPKIYGAPPVWSAEDRTLKVEPGHVVRTAWVPIDSCVMGNRSRMSPEAVEAKYRRLLCQGDAAIWPPITGVWSGAKFTIHDGRHEYLASLMLGREKILIAWIVEAEQDTQ